MELLWEDTGTIYQKAIPPTSPKQSIGKRKKSKKDFTTIGLTQSRSSSIILK
jgi:hypothetical protein